MPIQAFLDEVKTWEFDLPQDLDAGEDLSRLVVLRSPHGAFVEAGQVYLPVSCPGMLLRVQDAAKQRVRLIVDMKMGATANNYGVVTLCFAASSTRPVNTHVASAVPENPKCVYGNTLPSKCSPVAKHGYNHAVGTKCSLGPK